ncbi:unnamed protein product [Plutella xylostella]|uniref:(diamondback moth) hypothetical protein n=1 Tax=Plutella xylostella TaxID=51655 RepID=A0A8S4G420_PLUXY|nr:unnamed protein product [Plutella xylostella]
MLSITKFTAVLLESARTSEARNRSRRDPWSSESVPRRPRRRRHVAHREAFANRMRLKLETKCPYDVLERGADSDASPWSSPSQSPLS